MTEEDLQELFARITAFEWDESKRGRNLRDHAIDFEDARCILDGPTIIRGSDRGDETRYMVFGFVNGAEIVVVCTLRNESCRLIAASETR